MFKIRYLLFLLMIICGLLIHPNECDYALNNEVDISTTDNSVTA